MSVTHRKRSKLFRISLTCGCIVLSRTTPRVPGSKFICTSGQAHGYSLGWTSWEHPDRGVSYNLGVTT